MKTNKEQLKKFLSIMAFLTVLSPTMIQSAESSSYHQMREFEELSAGKSNLTLKMKWRDDELYYVFTISPVDQKKYDALNNYERYYAGFHLFLRDEDSFDLLDIPISLSEFTHGYSKDSDDILTLEANDSVHCSLETYKLLKKWNYSYNEDIFIKE